MSLNKNKVLGFTLIELLIVISIIGILSGVLIAVINPDRQRKRVAEVVNAESIRKVAIAVEAYSAVNGAYPAEGKCNWNPDIPTSTTCQGYLTEWPKSEPDNNNEITYRNSSPSYYIYVNSKLTPGKYLCYIGSTGKVFKDCNSSCAIATNYACVEGVL